MTKNLHLSAQSKEHQHRRDNFHDVLAMVEQLGKPTYFLTLSSADL